MTYTISTTWEIIIGLVVIWDLAWRGWALWRAAHNGHKGWYILLLVLNSAGILPIIYLLSHKENA